MFLKYQCASVVKAPKSLLHILQPLPQMIERLQEGLAAHIPGRHADVETVAVGVNAVVAQRLRGRPPVPQRQVIFGR